MDVYAPGWLDDVDSIRVLITHTGFVQMAVNAPERRVKPSQEAAFGTFMRTCSTRCNEEIVIG